MSSSAELDAIAGLANHLHAGKYFQLAAFVMLVYDHILTFPDEVDRIWKQKVSGATVLFLLARYVTPLQFIIILDAFHDPIWTKSVCNHFVLFEGTSTVGLVAVCQLIMILRVYALYGRSLPVLTFLLALWAAQIIISSVGLRAGYAAPLPPPLTGCILTGSSTLFPSVWVAPLITDTCIFAMTLWRTRRYLRESGRIPTLHIFVRDGAMYFLAIFMANLMNTLIYFTSPPDIKPIGASFSQLLTVVMVSRLVLNLRQPSRPAITASTFDSTPGTHGRDKTREISFVTRTLGNLAYDLDPSDDSDNHVQARRFEVPMITISRGQLDL